MIPIRKAEPRDLPAIACIYNAAILHSTATFDEHPKTDDDMQVWFQAHCDGYPIVVASVGEDKVVGWGAISPFSDRCAYRHTVEVSFYVAEDYRQRGIGRALLTTLVAEATSLGHHSMVARVAAENVASLRLLASARFDLAGTLREVGFKFGRWLDVQLLQRILPNGPKKHTIGSGQNPPDGISSST